MQSLFSVVCCPHSSSLVEASRAAGFISRAVVLSHRKPLLETSCGVSRLRTLTPSDLAGGCGMGRITHMSKDLLPQTLFFQNTKRVFRLHSDKLVGAPAHPWSFIV